MFWFIYRRSNSGLFLIGGILRDSTRPGHFRKFRSRDQANFVLNSIEKVKPGFSLSLMCMFPESNGTKFWSHSFHLQNSDILQTRIDYENENEFWRFSNTKLNITNSLSLKSRWKKNGICLVLIFASSVMVLKLPKIVHFLQNCANLSKKSKSIEAIYLYPSERPHQALSEDSMFYRGLSNSSRILRNKISKKCSLSRNSTKFINFKR